MGKRVAVEGDVSATPGGTPFAPAVSGAWVPGPVSYQSSPRLKSQGVAVVHQASCVFVFAGVGPANAPVSGQEQVTLTAGSTRLTSSQAVLVDGDSATGVYGNKLQVTASSRISTA